MLDGAKRRSSSVYEYTYTEDERRLALSNIFINTTFSYFLYLPTYLVLKD